jgi:hypothetical protein
MKSTATIIDREAIRKNFRPAKVCILFVGESPPANGRFFYVSSTMTHNMAQVFEYTFAKKFNSESDFLIFFKAMGCYLDDLSHTPLDKLPRPERKRVVANCVPQLAERMKEYQPEYVIAVLKSIESDVLRASHLANLKVPFHAIPFPGQGQQRRFKAELSVILKSIWKELVSTPRPLGSQMGSEHQ